MAKRAGRDYLLKKDNTTIAGCKQTSLKVAGSPINVETQTDNGVQTLLDGIVTGKNLEVSVEGYTEDDILLDISLGPDAAKFMTDLTLHPANGDTIACDFFLSLYEETGEFEEGVTFTATFMSDGAHTHTKA